MHPDLEAIVSLDEQLRARLRATDRELRASLETHREEAERQREARRTARAQALERDVRVILDDADRDMARRCSERRAYLDARERAAETRLERAVDQYLKTVLAVPDSGEGT